MALQPTKTTEYIFGAGGGRDLIQNFYFDEDKINVGKDAVTNVRLNSAGNVRLQVGIDTIAGANDGDEESKP